MKLEKFAKNKKQKGIVIGSIVGILLLIGGITLYRTFAMYKVEKSFDVLNGTVPDFSSGDVTLAILVNGHKSEKIPEENNNYKVIVSCENAEGNWDYNNWGLSITKITENKVKCNIYFSNTFSGYIMSLSNIDEDIIKQEHEATEQTGNNAITDYRYIGANPNNYVCLEESVQCTEENLYRIIGVIPTQKEENGDYEDRVKLIKNQSDENSYAWGNSDDQSNGKWSEMKLNTETLNTTYWNEITNYQKYIENAKWYISRSKTQEISPLVRYQEERALKMPSIENYSTSIVANVGLFNGSDYYFATSGSTSIKREQCLKTYEWSNNSNIDCKENDWLYDSTKNYWTINLGSKETGTSVFNAMALKNDGVVGNMSISTSSGIYIKQSFYLKSNVQYKSGNGTQDEPYRVTINEN